MMFHAQAVPGHFIHCPLEGHLAFFQVLAVRQNSTLAFCLMPGTQACQSSHILNFLETCDFLSKTTEASPLPTALPPTTLGLCTSFINFQRVYTLLMAPFASWLCPGYAFVECLAVLLLHRFIYFAFEAGFTLQSRLASNLMRFLSASTGRAGQVNTR